MTSMTLFIIIVVIIALLFLVINLIFAPHNPYQEKYSIFECGFHSFLGQNRTQFGVKFFIFALVYLLLDLEILLTYPFAVSGYLNNIYGLIITLVFIGIITIGFIFELGKSALKIDSRQTLTNFKVKPTQTTEFISKKVNNGPASSGHYPLKSSVGVLPFYTVGLGIFAQLINVEGLGVILGGLILGGLIIGLVNFWLSAGSSSPSGSSSPRGY
jgi:NADH-ubiquinone oxidoreductase chain 3